MQAIADDDKNLVTTLQLRIHASNLPRYGILKSLPSTFAKVTSVSGTASRSGPTSTDNGHPNERGTRRVEWGTTEIIKKQANPQFINTFKLEYEYGSECYFYVQIFRYPTTE
jgi:hypothetical protein